MTIEYIWADTYTTAVHAFDGQTPGRELEAQIIERFEASPEAVIAAIDKLAERFQAGKVHTPWPLVLRESADVDRTHIIADGRAERERSIRQAEAWIRNAGLHCPTLDDIQHELFEARQALLAPWRHDELLQQRMATLWREMRPTGEQLDAEVAERAQRWLAAQERLYKATGSHLTPRQPSAQ